jgi:hypothetical protein
MERNCSILVLSSSGCGMGAFIVRLINNFDTLPHLAPLLFAKWGREGRGRVAVNEGG